MTNPLFSRRLKVLFHDLSANSVSSLKMKVEEKLKLLGDLNWFEVQTFEEIQSADLLILNAVHVPDSEFSDWLEKLKQKMANKIWTPALIFSDIGFTELRRELLSAVASNWYFDIVNPSELQSLPIRVANLIRIHDHLGELLRYEEQLTELSAELADVQARLGD